MPKTTEEMLNETIQMMKSFDAISLNEFLDELTNEEALALVEGSTIISDSTITEGVGDWMKKKRDQVKSGWNKAKAKVGAIVKKGKEKVGAAYQKARGPARVRLARMKVKQAARDAGHEIKTRAADTASTVAGHLLGGVPLIGGALKDTIARRRHQARAKADERHYAPRYDNRSRSFKKRTFGNKAPVKDTPRVPKEEPRVPKEEPRVRKDKPRTTPPRPSGRRTTARERQANAAWRERGKPNRTSVTDSFTMKRLNNAVNLYEKKNASK